jgi:hypothetical protein
MEPTTPLISLTGAGAFLLQDLTATQQLIRLAGISLLASLLLSHQRESGRPSFLVSGLATLASGVALLTQLLPRVHDLQDGIDVLPLAMLLMLFCGTFGMEMALGSRADVLRVHLAVTVGMALCVGVDLSMGAVGGMGLNGMVCVECDAW